MPSDTPPDAGARAPRSIPDVATEHGALDGETFEHPIPPDSLRPYDLNTELKNSLMPPPSRWSDRRPALLFRQTAVGFAIALVGFAGGGYATSQRHAARTTVCAEMAPREPLQGAPVEVKRPPPPQVAPAPPQPQAVAELKAVAVPAQPEKRPVAARSREPTRMRPVNTKAPESAKPLVTTPSIAKTAKERVQKAAASPLQKSAGTAPPTAGFPAASGFPQTDGYKPPTASF